MTRTDYSGIPSVHVLKENLLKDFPYVAEGFLSYVINNYLTELRREISQGGACPALPDISAALSILLKAHLERSSFKHIINGTGIVLHTGLGRAPLSGELLRRFSELEGYVDLELELESGQRGERNHHIRPLLNFLCASEQSLVVNNNAAAVLLALTALGQKREIIVSRSQQVEIGGSFRIPDVMKQSGAIMIEVGATNRTRIEDFQAAISPRTAALFLAHSSNYTINGFTEFPDLAELVRLARQKKIPLIYDLGSGRLGGIGTKLEGEKDIQEILSAGCDLVSFSGDKLLGGPQAGLLCGRQAIIDILHRHPLYRALRPDKLTLFALEATLQSYIRNDLSTPTQRLLGRSREDLDTLYKQVLSMLPQKLQARLSKARTVAESGSGTAPGHELPSLAIAFVPEGNPPADRLARAFRTDPRSPVLGYIHKDCFYIDLRAVESAQIPALAETILRVLSSDL